MNEPADVKSYNMGYRKGLQDAEEAHDDAYWLRKYAGMAMQGIMAGGYRFDISQGNKEGKLIAKASLMIATALLAEVKDKEVA